MNLHMDLQIFLDWIRRHLSEGFNEKAQDVYTDEYEIALDRLTTLGSDMRKAVQNNDKENYIKFKELYIETFSFVSMELIRDEIDDTKDEILEAAEYCGNPISHMMAEHMAVENVASSSFPNNYWAQHLDEEQIPTNYYTKTTHPKKELRSIRSSFVEKRSSNDVPSHTINCYNSLFNSNDDLSGILPIHKAREERLKRIKKNRPRNSFLSASNPLPRHYVQQSKSRSGGI